MDGLLERLPVEQRYRLRRADPVPGEVVALHRGRTDFALPQQRLGLYAQTAVAPYAVRALPGAPVATPVAWEELDDVRNARQWTMRTIGDRLTEDPWEGTPKRGRSLTRARHLLARIAEDR